MKKTMISLVAAVGLILVTPGMAEAKKPLPRHHKALIHAAKASQWKQLRIDNLLRGTGSISICGRPVAGATPSCFTAR